MWSDLYNLIRRARISLTNADDKKYTTAQAEFMDKVAYIETIYPYGLYAQAPENSLSIVFAVQGAEENLAGICYNSESRFSGLQAGEVLVGNPQSQAYVKFDKDGNITIISSKAIAITSTQTVTVNSPKVDLGIGGNKIARLGDAVTVNVMGTPYTGTITSAGNNTSI